MGLRNELWERLAILENGGLTSKPVTAYGRAVIDIILERKPDIDEDKIAMFITHLAMAAQRAINGIAENPIGPEVLASVKQEAVYTEAEQLSGFLQKQTAIVFPQTEQEYLVVHLCNLLS